MNHCSSEPKTRRAAIESYAKQAEMLLILSARFQL